MTKRKLFNIIIALVILDIGAAFWYFASRADKEESASMAFDKANSAQNAVEADTIGDAPIPDRYAKIKETHNYFISTKPAIDDDSVTYYGCAKHTWLRLPLSINGNKNVSRLLEEVKRKLWKDKFEPFDLALKHFQTKPEFNSADEVAYKEISYKPNVPSAFFTEQTVKVFPDFTSNIYLVMRLEKTVVTPSAENKQLAFVVYDRERQNVISWSEIINYNESKSILKFINAKIDALNAQEDKNYQHAFDLPLELRPGRYGIMFVFPQGTIADSEDGFIEIFLPYNEILPFLTTSFQSIVKRNNGYWEYKSL